jgi:uncharacterized membrane protein YdjX (TVP38/TMEM64 family)
MKQVLGLGCGLLLCSIVAALMLHQDWLVALQSHLASLDPWLAAPVYVVSFVVGGLFMLPASAFLIVAGALFGFVMGAMVGMLGFILNAVVTFTLCRYWLRDLVVRVLPVRVVSAMAEVEQDGWKLVAGLRLAGFIPSGMISYALAITPIKTWDYSWASLIFTLPAGLMFVYMGSLGRQMLEGQASLFQGLSILGVLVLITLAARRMLSKTRRS